MAIDTLDKKAKVTMKAEVTTTVKAFKLAPLVHTLESLRNDASEHHEQYELGGRKALDALMSKVYKVYYETVTYGKVEEMSTQVRAKLKAIDANLEPSKGAKLSNMLIRYVFKDPDPKQVSVYARALRVVYERKTEPSDFVAVVAAQPGGYSGFKEAKQGVAPKTENPAATALSRVVNEQPIDTISIEWEAGEEVKVLIAHRNDDDEATLHAVNLTPEQRDAMLVRYVSAIDRAAKIAEAAKPLDLQVAIAKAEGTVAAEKMRKLEAQQKLMAAKQDKPKANHKALEDALAKAGKSLDIAKEELKELKARK